MFAVPGWSLAADALKPETTAPGNGAGPAKSRKRKRPNSGNRDKGEVVTTENVADLYASVVGGVKTRGEKQKPAQGDAAKRQRKDAAAKPKKEGDGHARAGEDGGEGEAAVAQAKKQKNKNKEEKQDGEGEENDKGKSPKHEEKTAKEGDKARKKKEKGMKEKKEKLGHEGESPKAEKKKTPAAAAADSQTASLPKPATTLTPLQASMREKLISARFRHLNETLYTRPSEESFSLFHENPEMFDEYHQGFRRQVKVWPENPVDSFLADIRTRAQIRAPHRGDKLKGRGGANHNSQQQQQQQQPPTELIRTALPRTHGTCIIADLGCGDARLAECLLAEKEGGDDGDQDKARGKDKKKGKGIDKSSDMDRLRLDVRSFDLQSPSPLVTRADIAALPLEDGSVDVAIFCLALMGTNWLDFIEEAYRILHWKGELWVAEIKSRFAPPASHKNAVVAHSVGHRRKTPGGGASASLSSSSTSIAASKKDKAARDAELQGRYEQDLAVEVDGLDDTRRETDVSAFVEALRRRGFVLHGERGEAVDLSNRMFVKMHFIKAAAPVVGKGVAAGREREGGAAAPPKKKMFQFEQGTEKEGLAAEAAILKPCVYKIR